MVDGFYRLELLEHVVVLRLAQDRVVVFAEDVRGQTRHCQNSVPVVWRKPFKRKDAITPFVFHWIVIPLSNDCFQDSNRVFASTMKSKYRAP
jgi:hypothetical protein